MDLARERLHGPVLAFEGDDVCVVEEDQRFAARPVALDLRDQRLPAGASR